MAKLIKEGLHTAIIEVTLEDAESIIALRNNPEINKFLSSSKAISVSEQKEWIASNQKQGNNAYFKIIDTHNGNFCGTISIYNIINNSGEFGRYICTQNLQAIESELLLIRLCFEELGLKKIFCKTVIENSRVWMQHYKFGFEDRNEEKGGKHNELTFKVQELKIEKYKSFDYTPIERLLNKFINR